MAIANKAGLKRKPTHPGAMLREEVARIRPLSAA